MHTPSDSVRHPKWAAAPIPFSVPTFGGAKCIWSRTLTQTGPKLADIILSSPTISPACLRLYVYIGAQAYVMLPLLATMTILLDAYHAHAAPPSGTSAASVKASVEYGTPPSQLHLSGQEIFCPVNL